MKYHRPLHPQNFSTMTYIKAPYNFVPLNKKVVSPYWADQISHDIPFEDAQSGSFKIKIKAHSPIMVVDGHAKSEERGAQQFTSFQNRYFIPGSSVKGMLRSVMEVMSFGNLANKVNDHRYALRDLKNEAYRSSFRQGSVFGGWLQQTGADSYTLQDCGVPGRISHKEIDKVFPQPKQRPFSRYFERNGDFDQKKDTHKSARHKYQLYETATTNYDFSFREEREDKGRRVYTFDPQSPQQGHLVFTGQSSPREFNQNQNKMVGHFYEFIFWQTNQAPQVVDTAVIKNFLFAYYDQEPAEQSEDFKHWRQELKAGRAIPVFFRKDQTTGAVSDLGLSYMYKLPYKNSIKEAIEKHQKKQGIDLAEAIFGYINEDENTALKGRVHVGHAFATKGEVSGKETLLLSTPRASYYPNYVRQQVDNRGHITSTKTNPRNGREEKTYHTYMDNNPEIAGWKRYPVHTSAVPVRVKERNAKMDTVFYPLKAKAEFELQVAYHNLKKIELGALLSAITFHETEEVYHSLGLAKAFGYGKISLEITEIDEATKLAALQMYEAYMNLTLNCQYPEWHQLPQIRELITMASEQDNSAVRSQLAYMQLKNQDNRGKNDFTEAKQRKNKEGLAPYTQLPGIQQRNATTLFPDETSFKTHLITIRDNQQWYGQQESAAISSLQATAKTTFCTHFNKRKQQLLEELEFRRQQLREQEAQQAAAAIVSRRGNKQVLAHAQAPDFSTVDLSNKKKAFDQLKKAAEGYAMAYHNIWKSKVLEAQFPDGWFPTEHRSALCSLLTDVFAQISSKKERQKWLKTNSAQQKKVATWVGQETMKKWFEELG